MKDCYKQMYEAFEGKSFRYNHKKVTFNELAHFSPICGEKYCSSVDKNGKALRFMLIGRCTNGWGQIDAAGAEDFASKMESKINNYGFHWIHEKDGVLYSPKEVESNEYYLPTKSAFWRIAKRIWVGLGGVINPNEPKWMENILWSNLYKIAPKEVPENGVATLRDTMIKVQHRFCKELLKAEIENFKPTHILLVTDWKWVDRYGEDSFLSIFETYSKTCNKYVVGNASYAFENGDTASVIITIRPERRNETEFVNSVLETFK